jgi:hypothetical protein
MVFLSMLQEFYFFLLREALVTSVAGVFRFVCSWWSALRQRGFGCTSALSLLFVDVHGGSKKKKPTPGRKIFRVSAEFNMKFTLFSPRITL